jgi:LmbE family N-acetylglucosaminyl deacetylase
VAGADDQLEPMPEDWDRALAVVAHPDDLEYGGAAAVARWTSQGKQVAYLLASRGEAGIDTMEPAKAAEVRTAEQIDSAQVVGVTDVTFLDHPDGTITYGLDLRRDIAAVIRRQRPELVLAVNHRETYGGTFLNMADHRVVGEATIDAVRDAGNRWVFPELRDAGLEPWGGVRYLAAISSPDATHAVDVTATFDLGVESLRRHSAYLEALGGPDPAEFLRQWAEETAARFGGRLAVPFELLGI